MFSIVTKLLQSLTLTDLWNSS